MRITGSIAAACMALAIAAPAQAAEDGGDFYAGRTITLIGAAGAAGSYGVWGRVIVEYLGRFVPGKPNIIFQAMPGAGGAKAANYVYNAAPKDGTVIGLLQKYVAVEQAIGRSAVKFDVRKFNWLISTGPINSVVAVWHTAPAKTLEEMKKTEVIMGSSGKSSETYITPTMMNEFFGTKFKVVTGYKGTGDIHVAMENGELHGRAAAWEGIRAGLERWITGKQIVLVAQSGLYKNYDLPDVPRLIDLATTPEARAMFEFVGGASTLGRAFTAPPDVPAERVALLRKAFETMVKDPQFVAHVKKLKLDYEPRSAAEVAELVRRTVEAPPETIAKARAIMD